MLRLLNQKRQKDFKFFFYSRKIERKISNFLAVLNDIFRNSPF